MSLSERIRPDIEAAPWVVAEVKKLESELAALREKLANKELSRQDAEMRCQDKSEAEEFWRNECAVLREKCSELEQTVVLLRTGDTCARHCEGTAYRLKANQLQHQLDETANQEPVAWAFEDGESLYSVALFDNGGTPLYRLPPNLPAMIEQAKAKYREDALRYRVLRNQDVNDNFPRSGLFIGCIPDDEVLTEEDADIAIDAIRARKP